MESLRSRVRRRRIVDGGPLSLVRGVGFVVDGRTAGERTLDRSRFPQKPARSVAVEREPVDTE